MTTEESRPRPWRRRRGMLIAAAAAAVFVVVYLTVVTLYARGGEVALSGSGGQAPEGAVILLLTPREVDAANSRITLALDLVDGGAYSTDGATLDEPLTVLLPAADGSRMILFPAGEVPSTHVVTLPTGGADGSLGGFIEQWPFDAYESSSLVGVFREGVDGEGDPVEYALLGAGRVPGWNLEGRTAVLETVVNEAGRSVDVGQLTVTAHRSGATVAFGMLLLSLMVVMPVLVLTVAITVLRRRRAVEATMLGWIAAMLFATVPLRTFLPGSPPIGSWIDYLVVLWVFAGLIAGLVVYVIAWLRDGPRPPQNAADQPRTTKSSSGVPVS